MQFGPWYHHRCLSHHCSHQCCQRLVSDLKGEERGYRLLYLMSQGVDPKLSFDIMEAVRKGKVKKGGFQPGWKEAMEEANVPDWYIQSLAKIGYLFP